MWDFRCPQLAGWAGSLLPEQPNCQGNQTAPTLRGGGGMSRTLITYACISNGNLHKYDIL